MADTISRRTMLSAAAALAVAPLGRGLLDRSTAGNRGPGDLLVGDGGWCWFQAPRATIVGDRLLFGSTQGSFGATPGAVEVTEVDLDRWKVACRHQIARDRVDDHTSPSVLATPEGPLVGWAPHRRADWIELGLLGQPLTRIIRPQALTPPGRGTSYVSAHLVGKQRWVLYRGEQFSWNLLTSHDGTTWQSRGLVVAPDTVGQRPYLQASADSMRLHLLLTDGNPTEFRGTNVMAATITADLTITDSAGAAIGQVGSAPIRPSMLTPIVHGAAGVDEPHDTDAWLSDLSVIDGQPTAVMTVRDPWPAGADRVGRWRHRFLWGRRNGDGSWHVEHLGWAGSELYANQPDYCGLGSVDPTNSRYVVVASDVHPVSGNPLRPRHGSRPRRELFEGIRQADQCWLWNALTATSEVDNLRPIIVADGRHRVLAWMQGRYRSWTDFDTQIVLRRLS